jgi:mono/diheme cytochrome c family protein
MDGRKPDSVTREQAEEIGRILKRLFGTPDEPKAPSEAGLRTELLAMAAGPVGGDAEGNQVGLFRRHCVTCHGVGGDGAGPSAALHDPYPRDFRYGVFKYTSTKSGAKPLKSDLKKTLARGAAGTAMPSFAQLAPEEIEALVEYVKYLSLRGETELYLLQQIVDAGASLPLGTDEVLEDGVLPAVAAWEAPERDRDLVAVPPPRPPVDPPERLAASIAKGKELYASKDAQCVKCHGPNGDGNGEEKDLYDDWNKRKKGVTAEETRAMAKLFRLPIQEIRPRDFRLGTFRGGAAPEDLYLRLYVGIKGTPMPGVGPGPGTPGVLTPEEIWHVVHYVRSLSRP